MQRVSAVKVLGIVSAQGQRIWTIDQNNLNAALSEISLSADTESEIRNSMLAGKIVTVLDTLIGFNGWVGSGCIIVDPVTGGCAYKISGANNGRDFLINEIFPGFSSFVSIASFLISLISDRVTVVSVVADGLGAVI